MFVFKRPGADGRIMNDLGSGERVRNTKRIFLRTQHEIGILHNRHHPRADFQCVLHGKLASDFDHLAEVGPAPAVVAASFGLQQCSNASKSVRVIRSIVSTPVYLMTSDRFQGHLSSHKNNQLNLVWVLNYFIRVHFLIAQYSPVTNRKKYCPDERFVAFQCAAWVPFVRYPSTNCSTSWPLVL